MAATVREYLVSLGAEVDQKSFNKFKTALHGSSLTVAKAGAAVAALTAILVKTSISLDETSQKYEAMAKKAHKTTEEIQAQETALKILGKTLKEVNADKQLKEQYQNLKKLGMTMSFPQAQGGVLTLRNMVKTVNELRVVGTYAMQWINYYMLQRIREPLKDLHRRLEGFKNNVKNNMPSWTARIGEFFGDFLRLVAAGIQGASDLIKKVKELPDGIKDIGAAIAAAFSFSKMGTVGWILAGLTAILVLLDDFYTYKSGGLSLFGDLWKSFEEGTTGDYVMEKLGGLLEGIEHFSEKFAEIIGGLDFGGMLGSAIEKGGNVISGILDFLFGDNSGQTQIEQQGLIDTLTISITNIVDALGKALEKAMFRDNGEKFGQLITSIFTKIGDYFKADENGNTPLKTLLTSAFDTIETAMSGIMDFLLGTLAGLDLSKMADSISTVISNVLDLVMTALDRGVKALTGYGDKQGLGGKLLDFIRNLLGNLGTLIKKIPFDQIGADIGSFVSGLFVKIGDFFNQEADKAANGDSLIGGLASTLATIVSGIVTLFSSALSHIEPEDVRKMANGIFKSIKDALTDIAKRITSDEIDLKDVGSKIGEGIGNAIKIGWEFIKTMLVEAFNWVTSGEGRSTLLAIGGAIVDGILAGLTQLGDKLGEAVFGEEKWQEMKNESKDYYGITSGEIQVPGYTQQDLIKLRSENPEEYNRLITEAKSEQWQSFMRSTNEKYGFPNPDALGLDAVQEFREANFLQIAPWWQESKDWNDIAELRKQAIEHQDTGNYEMAVSAMTAFATAWKNGLRGEDLRKSITEASGYDFNNRGHGGTITTDNDEAMKEIAETDKALKELDGTTANTTINISENYTSNGGGGRRKKNITGTATEESLNAPGKAGGGFFGKPTVVTVGDDGDEAIIPMTNPSRAKGLIMQMFSRMGSSANDILASLGVSGGGASSGFGGPGMPASMQPAGMYPSAGGAITSNSGNTVSAPTTINVYGSGDPLAAGNAAAKASERNIVRRVRGCFEQ